MGVPENTVRLLGRWASDVHCAYTWVALGNAMRVSAAMGRARPVGTPTSSEGLFPGFNQPA